jgi:hypothetical protein
VILAANVWLLSHSTPALSRSADRRWHLAA